MAIIIHYELHLLLITLVVYHLLGKLQVGQQNNVVNGTHQILNGNFPRGCACSISTIIIFLEDLIKDVPRQKDWN